MAAVAVGGGSAVGPIRGAGDGMETEKPPAILEVITDAPPTLLPELPLLKVASPKHNPKPTHVAHPTAPQPLGVLHLGKVQREACTEVEAVRIIVPRAAISRSGRVATSEGKDEGQQAEEQGPPLLVEDWRGQLEKLQNSERRLLQDKEGLSNQLRVQTEVNRELKKLLVASMGDDLQYQFERLAREKNQLILENEALGRSLAHTAEQLERMSIQCDVWRSKFLASRVMAEELTNARAALQRQIREAQGAIQDLLLEREEFSRDMVLSHRSLEQLLVSLQWGRQQTYYPSAQPLSFGELAAANHKLADAINSHLLGKNDTKSNTGKSSGAPAEQLCSTPAEKMAEKVLKVLNPISCSENKEEPPLCESPSPNFLNSKKSIGRFHPYTRYENITFNCCERCTGDIIVL
ncbi:PREDICTED: golgin-45 [Cyprinodon variegatus]|uniref:Basic leucine zipper nuclear factor 1 n=1 Tax=Cyprinodon variegatus TaxID=28743 RepID=A0A3Q2CZZ7_CYPVA|nr:PREDICTED: golgin-45 [Cyprinodon variegatus]XP_015258789.1 PREDICTED: golgin-45 [Cyprinodon variegatus]XP_015258790.1 PREDICTED: golgin-45 [Cyprinodon variegatus]